VTPVSVPVDGIDEETLKLLILSKRESNYKNAIDNNFIKRDISLHYRIILDLRNNNSFEEQVGYLQQYFSDINHYLYPRQFNRSSRLPFELVSLPTSTTRDLDSSVILHGETLCENLRTLFFNEDGTFCDRLKNNWDRSFYLTCH
jgi:hypothetical protein